MRYLLVILSLICSAAVMAAPQNQLPTSPPTESEAIKLNEKGVQAMGEKKFALAEEFFNKAYQLDRGNTTFAFNLAGAYITNKKERAAILLLSDLTKHYSSDAGLFARLGDAYFSNKQPKEALTSYEQAYSIDPKYPALARKLANLQIMLDQREKAKEYYESALLADPEDLESLNNLSNLLLALKKPDEAIRAAKRALQIKVSSDTYKTLGAAYEMQSDSANALISYEKAQALGDKSAELTAKVAELKKLKT